MKPQLTVVLPQSRPEYESHMIANFHDFDVSFLRSARSGLRILGRAVPWRRILFVESSEHLGIAKLERSPDNVVIATLELHSPESYIVSKRHPELIHVVLVWETLKNHPYYFVPPIGPQSRYVGKNADLFVAFTQRSATHLVSLGVSPYKISIVYPGIDLTRFTPSSNQDDSDKTRFLYVGLLERHKGLDTLLRAFQYTKDPCFELSIVGTGSLAEMVKEFSEKDHRIIYKGWIPHDRIHLTYRESDVFCCPSVDSRLFHWRHGEEQFGFSLVEAMASGLPIVSTNCGAIPEIIGPQNVLVAQQSVRSLTQALQKVGGDQELRTRLSKENRSRAENMFDIVKQSSTLEDKIVQLLQR